MPLLIVGASVRAAAQSARRAGLEPTACDLFADLDLQATCGKGRALVIPRDAYPDGFESIAVSLPPGPWMFTGAIENHPDLVDRIAAIRPLWGIAGQSLRDVRDPFAVSDVLARRGLAAPSVCDDPDDLPRDGSWLVKPRGSAGGRAIRPLVEICSTPARPSYYQSRIDGPSVSAVYVGRGDGSIFVGASRQMIGRAGEPFAYVGSVGPWPENAEIAAVGDALAKAFGLRGVFGVDLVIRSDGRPVAVEVNPRYPASAEVLELASGRSILAEHRRAFEPDAPIAEHSRPNPPAFVGKAILFADRPSRLSPFDLNRIRSGPLATFAVPTIADLPDEGTEFDAGDPVLTVLARGLTMGACETNLARRLARWRCLLRELPLVPVGPCG